MSYTHFTCIFEGRAELNISLMKSSQNTVIPLWTTFQNFPCPGNLAHGPDISYCRLACDINSLVAYFSDINSYEQGYIHIYEADDNSQGKEIIIHKDAQNIFFYAIWLILIKTPCSVFKYQQKLRENYVLTSDIKKIFYTFFTIFLLDSHFKSPDKGVQLTEFREQLQLFQEVLSNLLERMRMHLSPTADTTNNGLVLLSSLVQQLEVELDSFYQELKKDVEYARQSHSVAEQSLGCQELKSG